jgi:hypothetical protein
MTQAATRTTIYELSNEDEMNVMKMRESLQGLGLPEHQKYGNLYIANVMCGRTFEYSQQKVRLSRNFIYVNF